MIDTNWVDRLGTKHPTCSCGLVNALANVVVVDVQHNAALAIVTGGVQGEATTAGFTIFLHIVAIVHTDPYLDLYHYFRMRTLTEVPRHSPFPPFFVN